MPRPPQQDDPDSGYSHTAHTTQRSKHPTRRRHMYHYQDDLPLTPPVRRASLQTDKTRIPSNSSLRRRQAKIREEIHELDEYNDYDDYSEYEEYEERNRRSRQRGRQLQRTYDENIEYDEYDDGAGNPEERDEYDDFAELDDYDGYNKKTITQTELPRVPETEKIVITRRPRSDIYVPPPNMRPARPSHASRSSRSSKSTYSYPSHGAVRFKRPIKSQAAPVMPAATKNSIPTFLQRNMQKFQSITQNRTVTFWGIMLLTMLVLLPVVLHFSHISSPSIISITMGQDTTNGNTANRSQSQDPHQLTIIPPNNGHPAPPVFATSAYLLDADTGTTLYAKNPFTHLPMLSTTKLMTALLAAEQGNADQKVTINAQITNDINQLSADSSLMGLKKGETYTMRDLLYGLFLVSGNDAAIAIADTIGGNLPNFVAKMNQRASQLGLKDSHFEDPHGLLMDNHYSSAHDLAFLGKASLGMPLLHQISDTKIYTLPQTAEHAAHTLSNGNQFLWWYPGTDGGKTGWDAAADFIQVVSCTRNNHHLIGVVMHTNDWWTDMRDLMNWGFNSFTWLSPHDLDTASNPIPFDADWNFFARDRKENTISMGGQGRYYIFTGYSISGAILTYFDKNGGLQKFGFPTSQPQGNQNALQSQRFERGTISCDATTKQCKFA